MRRSVNLPGLSHVPMTEMEWVQEPSEDDLCDIYRLRHTNPEMYAMYKYRFYEKLKEKEDNDRLFSTFKVSGVSSSKRIQFVGASLKDLVKTNDAVIVKFKNKRVTAPVSPSRSDDAAENDVKAAPSRSDDTAENVVRAVIIPSIPNKEPVSIISDEVIYSEDDKEKKEFDIEDVHKVLVTNDVMCDYHVGRSATTQDYCSVNQIAMSDVDRNFLAGFSLSTGINFPGIIPRTNFIVSDFSILMDKRLVAFHEGRRVYFSCLSFGTWYNGTKLIYCSSGDYYLVCGVGVVFKISCPRSVDYDVRSANLIYSTFPHVVVIDGKKVEVKKSPKYHKPSSIAGLRVGKKKTLTANKMFSVFKQYCKNGTFDYIMFLVDLNNRNIHYDIGCLKRWLSACGVYMIGIEYYYKQILQPAFMCTNVRWPGEFCRCRWKLDSNT